MRLIVKQNNSTISEFQFAKGPIYVGRHKDSQIFLGHRAVSRQHAVIFQADDGKWMVEDLDSANKTYLNDEPVHKVQIKTGDLIRIIDFVIEVKLEDITKDEKPIDLEDTLTKTAYDLQTVLATLPREVLIRKTDMGHAPDMKLPAKRLSDFSRATEAIAKAKSPDELLLSLLDIILDQLDAFHAWCALRKQPAGPMTAHAGKQKSGQKLNLAQIKLSDKINQAVESGQYLVLPQASAEIQGEHKIRSAMIAPVIGASGCLGVLYVDNAVDSKHYNLGDLDYLMMLSIHTAAVMKKLS